MSHEVTVWSAPRHDGGMDTGADCSCGWTNRVSYTHKRLLCLPRVDSEVLGFPVRFNGRSHTISHGEVEDG